MQARAVGIEDVRDWPALSESMARPLVVDGRNFLDAGALRDAGFTYEGIGRPNGDS